MPTQLDKLPEVDFRKDGEDSLQFLWAVSYSDLLLVMLTFFIIFYQYSDSFSKSPLEKIVVKLKTEANAVEAGVQGEGTASRGPATSEQITFMSLESLRNQVKNGTTPNMGKENYRGGLVVNLSENIYKPAEFNMTPQIQSELKAILDVVKPQADKLALTFIGHADDKPVVRVGANVIDSNLVLSNLRAARAVQFAVAEGFDPRWIAAQGVGEYRRNSRSLSVQIVERSRP